MTLLLFKVIAFCGLLNVSKRVCGWELIVLSALQICSQSQISGSLAYKCSKLHQLSHQCEKYCHLETRIQDYSRSLEMTPLDDFIFTFY